MFLEKDILIRILQYDLFRYIGLKTFWVNPHAFKTRGGASEVAATEDEKVEDQETAPTRKKQRRNRSTKVIKDGSVVKKDRLVGWVYQLLRSRLKAIVGTRSGGDPNNASSNDDFKFHPENGKTALDELTEKIELPKFHEVNASHVINSSAFVASFESVTLPRNVEIELKCFTEMIASLYHDNSFHNFEHACHVTMSVNKLLSRIVTPDKQIDAKTQCLASHMHEYTHGINSDPITLFAILFSAVIHDCDHRGISNVQLCKEEESMGVMYRNKSVAEQNSLDLAWNMLMSDSFTNLRKALFETEREMNRFRQVAVNMVLATDIFDKELNELRKNRWTKAFSQSDIPEDIMNDLRATIVMEHLIQASDVSHTMQHWHVYRKWNKLLFGEMLLAYRSGRMGADPSTFWYTGELSFFDNYVIPLAKKLKDCQVFGVSSDEYLNYAEQNRAEWEARGNEIVEEMLSEFNANDKNYEEPIQPSGTELDQEPIS